MKKVVESKSPESWVELEGEIVAEPKSPETWEKLDKADGWERSSGCEDVGVR